MDNRIPSYLHRNKFYHGNSRKKCQKYTIRNTDCWETRQKFVEIKILNDNFNGIFEHESEHKIGKSDKVFKEFDILGVRWHGKNSFWSSWRVNNCKILKIYQSNVSAEIITEIVLYSFLPCLTPKKNIISI